MISFSKLSKTIMRLKIKLKGLCNQNPMILLLLMHICFTLIIKLIQVEDSYMELLLHGHQNCNKSIVLI